MAADKAAKIFANINAGVAVKIRYSFTYQTEFIKEILERGAVDAHYNRFEVQASINQGTLTLYKGKTENKISLDDDKVVRFAQADLDDLLSETVKRVEEIDLNDEEIVCKLKQIQSSVSKRFSNVKRQQGLKSDVGVNEKERRAEKDSKQPPSLPPWKQNRDSQPNKLQQA